MGNPIKAFLDAKDAVERYIEFKGKIQGIEAQETIADLRQAMVGLKEPILRLQEENLDLRSEIEGRRSTADLTKAGECYAQFSGNGSMNAGPFCTRCYESDGKAVSLVANTKEFRVFGTHKCPECRTNVTLDLNLEPDEL